MFTIFQVREEHIADLVCSVHYILGQRGIYCRSSLQCSLYSRLEKNIMQIQSAVFIIFQVREENIADLVCSLHYILGQKGIYFRSSLQCSLYSRLERNILQIQSAVFTIFLVREEYIVDLVCSVYYILGQRGIYCRSSLQCSLYSGLERNILQIQSVVFTIFQVREEYIADLVCSVQYILGQRRIYCRSSLQCTLYSRLERNILQIQSAVFIMITLLML